MKQALVQRVRALALCAVIAGVASTAAAVDSGAGVGAPGPGLTRVVSAPGVGGHDPCINPPGFAGNVGGVARRSVRL